MNIPADMNCPELAAQVGAKACVSIRDMMILLGASDGELRDSDEQDEILAREPWRRDTILDIPVGKPVNGMQACISEGGVDWRGTRFHKDTKRLFFIERSSGKKEADVRDVPKDPIEDALPYVPFAWFGRVKGMNEGERQAALAEWMKTRPECVQKLAAEFPPGTELEAGGKRVWVMGWTEADRLIVSPTDPREDYDGAVREKQHVCADHYRERR